MKLLLLQLFAIILLVSCTQGSNDIKIENPELEDDNTELSLSCEFLNDTIINDNSSVLTESEENFYFEIWKSELLNKNGMEISYFDEHFKNVKISSREWNGGITFDINYLFTYDWMKYKGKDQFLVKLNSSWSSYQHLGIPRDELLDEEWTKYIIRNEIHNIGICNVKKIESLPYNSCAEAAQSFKDLSGYQLIEPTRISLYVPGKVPRIDGYPYFIGNAIIDSISEQCVGGHFNIVTGDFEVWEYYCGPIN